MSESPTRAQAPRKRSKSHIFDAMIAEAKRTPPEDLIDAEELDRRRPLTAEEIAAADAEVDRLLAEEAAPEETEAERTGALASATNGQAPKERAATKTAKR